MRSNLTEKHARTHHSCRHKSCRLLKVQENMKGYYKSRAMPCCFSGCFFKKRRVLRNGGLEAQSFDTLFLQLLSLGHIEIFYVLIRFLEPGCQHLPLSAPNGAEGTLIFLRCPSTTAASLEFRAFEMAGFTTCQSAVWWLCYPFANNLVNCVVKSKHVYIMC